MCLQSTYQIVRLSFVRRLRIETSQSLQNARQVFFSMVVDIARMNGRHTRHPLQLTILRDDDSQVRRGCQCVRLFVFCIRRFFVFVTGLDCNYFITESSSFSENPKKVTPQAAL